VSSSIISQKKHLRQGTRTILVTRTGNDPAQAVRGEGEKEMVRQQHWAVKWKCKKFATKRKNIAALAGYWRSLSRST
jgi:hypothetical protein